MNIGAHLAWSATFVASGEAADQQQNLLAAAFSYYYSVFHAGFALINTDHTFNAADMERIHHNKIEDYLDRNLPPQLSLKAKNLRVIREFLSYLGADDPGSKLRIVRGHGISTDIGTNNIRELVDLARNDSKEIFTHIYSCIEVFCKKNTWQPLQYGRDYFVREYLDEDLLLNVIPRDEKGLLILKRTVELLS